MPDTIAAQSAVLAAVDAGLEAARARLFELLRIPSISTQPAHAPDCARAGEWVCEQLRDLGFRAELCPTPGHPVVLGQHAGPAGYRGPHVLFYGHYDVQPVDPLELWTSPPFEPQLVDGPRGQRFVARGAVDDKGQMMMFIEALRAWKAATGEIPARITTMIEGEEEVGSAHLEDFIRAHHEALRADLALISDTGMWDVNTPAITTRLRGMVYTEFTLTAANRDLHSGMFGGSALNPINAITRILGELKDAGGRIRLPGFYDEVETLPAAQAMEWAALGFDEGAFLGDVGLSEPAGEWGMPALRRLWARPAADINGIWGGYTGPGAKTVIPSEAAAKVSFRLVPHQDPEKILASFKSFVEDRLPADARVEWQVFSSAPAIEVPTDGRWVGIAREILAEEYGRAAVLIGCGGSVPVVASMKRLLGLDTLLMGFGLDDDQIHSPNEKFEQVCFHRGIRSHARLLGRFGAA